MTEARPDPRLQLVFDESQRMIANQREDLERFRTRAAGLISVAALSVGILARFSGARSPRHGWLAAAIIAFILLVAGVSYVLFPRTMVFENDPRILVADFVDAPGGGIDDMLRSLSRFNADNRCSNEQKLTQMMWAYMLAIVALGVAVITLLLAYVP